jgi:YegS/Rv2252/BmrU family lipid kinase
MNSYDQWLVIVNPNAGTRKGQKDWKEIANHLGKVNLKFEAFFTQGIGDATCITQEKIEAGYRKIIVVGGDGTLNEVVNGIFLQKSTLTTEVLLGIIPIGTGNDWGRMYGIPSDYKKAVEVIHEQHTIIQDAGVAKYSNGENEITRYFINAAGMGFDAEVVRKTNIDKQHGKGGILIYLKNLIASLIGYHAQQVVIDIDGRQRTDSIFSVSIGICRFTGGGMMQAPDAMPNDGLLDITIIRNISRLEVIRNIPRLFNGTIGKNPKVELLQGKTVNVYGDSKIYLEADGETLGHSPLHFSIIPLSVNMIIAKDVK